jgi:Tol biopolymer transport system component
MHGILVVNVDGSDERVVIEAESIEQVAWSTDGARVSFVERGRLYIATSDGSDRRVLTDVVMGTTTSWSPDGARIALQGDDGDIHVIDIASGVDQPITSGPGRDASPRWSPAGDEIVFVRGSDVGATLWIASADGTRERALTTPREPGVDGWTAADFSPVWSPDGRQVAYLLDDNPSSGFLLPEDDDQASLAVIDSDGANQRVVAEDVSARDEPVWSPVQVSDLDQFTTPLPVTPPPTTDQIAFASNRDGNAEIYLVNADGSGLTRLTDNPSSDTSPTWAPDGSQLAFVSDRAAEPDLYDLYVMDADGTNVVRLTEGARAAVPVWSPDGEWIAFVGSTDDGLLDIFVVRPDGSDLTRLTDWPGIDTFPSWSQDGGGLVYQSDSGTGANDDIIYTSVDGTNTGAFTTDPRSQREPDWSPDGVRVAFASGSIERRMGHGVAIFDTIAVATINAADPAGRLTDTGLMGSTPRWSPDATWLAFRAPQLDPDGITATGELLMVMRPDGTGAQQLFGPVDETSLDYAWSPDSNRLAVTASTEDYDGLALYAVSLDGSEPLLLAEDVERLSRPAWRPTRRSPIFVPTPTVAPAPKPTIALTPTPSEPEAALDTAIAALPEGERGCTVTPARDTSPGGMEVQGKVLLGEGELWANYFSQGDVDDDRMIAGQSGTIYWSLETSFADTLRVVAVDPASGERVLPSWGPVAGSSPWRAGSVWRTFFTFPHAGCWELRVVRGESAGVLWLEVVAPSAQPSPTSGARVPAAVDAMRPL